jgi:hypothetical protein
MPTPTTYTRDLWPADIKAETVVSPQEMLEDQARHLETRAQGLLVGHVIRNEHEDRVVLRFEVEAPRAQTRTKLFEVQHRTEFEYPAAFIQPEESLPDFLKTRVFRPGGIGETVRHLREGTWIENEWVATSPDAFCEKLEQVLKLHTIKPRLLSLLSRVTGEQSRANVSQDGAESANEGDE